MQLQLLVLLVLGALFISASALEVYESPCGKVISSLAEVRSNFLIFINRAQRIRLNPMLKNIFPRY